MSAQTPPIEPGVSHELAKWRAARYSDVRYTIGLTLEKMSPVLKGTMEIRLSVRKPSPGRASANVIRIDGAPVAGAMSRPEIIDVPIILDWRKIKGHEEKSTISNVSLNGKPVSLSTSWPPADAGGSDFNEHLIFSHGVVLGENVIKLDFTSPILTSGSAITRYIDKEDGSEYIYSLFVPSDASTAFPVFDQPDLKARFTLSASVPKSWKLVSNSYAGVSVIVDGICGLPLNDRPLSEVLGSFVPDSPRPTPSPTPQKTPVQPTGVPCEMSDIWTSAETKPISTYVFAFAAGPWQVVERVAVANELPGAKNPVAIAPGSDKGSLTAAAGTDGPSSIKRESEQMYRDWKREDVTHFFSAETQTSIYVRKSQAAKFKQHSAEVFRLNREAINHLEEYFDYKFPFPKYDLVLIPEFPFGGMEHAGATFLREDRIIFPQEPTKNDYITRANLMFHEAAHQWFGDTVTMKWFDDLWLKEGFAEFMAYKTLEKVMPEYNAWKVFYERNKQAAYLTDSTKGTTPIYQEIANLNAAKSAYGNIVYRKAPSFLKQAEFYIGSDNFQTAVRALLKKHEFANAGWEDLVNEFETASKTELSPWAQQWVTQPGLPVYRSVRQEKPSSYEVFLIGKDIQDQKRSWTQKMRGRVTDNFQMGSTPWTITVGGDSEEMKVHAADFAVNHNFQLNLDLYFPNYQDYGYGIFLLDDKSRDYVLKNIHTEKDDFLRTMMWGSLWDSVREAELDPKQYVELVVKNIKLESDESTIQTLLGRVSTALSYYVSDAERAAVVPTVEALLIDRMQNAATPGQRITYYRAFLNLGSSPNARRIMKTILKGGNVGGPARVATKDKFDIVTRLMILGDPEAPKLLADLEKTETSDEAKRYAYAARAGLATAENKAKFWDDFVSNKQISESWIEAAFGPFNSIRHADLTLPFLERALQELPNHKRNRKIFFVNGWLGAFIGGQRSEKALAIVNKFLADNPSLDRDLRLKILENVDVIERAVKIRAKFGTKRRVSR